MVLGYFYLFSYKFRDDLVENKTRIKMGFVKDIELNQKLSAYNYKVIYFIIRIENILEYSISLKEKISCYFPVTDIEDLVRLLKFLKFYFEKSEMENLAISEFKNKSNELALKLIN